MLNTFVQNQDSTTWDIKDIIEKKYRVIFSSVIQINEETGYIYCR